MRLEQAPGIADPLAALWLVVVLHHHHHVAAREASQAIVAPDLMHVRAVEEEPPGGEHRQPGVVLGAAVVVDEHLVRLIDGLQRGQQRLRAMVDSRDLRQRCRATGDTAA